MRIDKRPGNRKLKRIRRSWRLKKPAVYFKGSFVPEFTARYDFFFRHENFELAALTYIQHVFPHFLTLTNKFFPFGPDFAHNCHIRHSKSMIDHL